jgi:XTP/dITP diphosphohydrolase
VEDTSLQVEGEAVGINIKWLIKELHNNPKYQGKKVQWIVYMGLVQSGNLYLVKGELLGLLIWTEKVGRPSDLIPFLFPMV